MTPGVTDNVPAQPYGPSTGAVRRFLVGLAALGPIARAAVVQRYGVVAASRAFVSADVELGELLDRSGRGDARDAIAGPLMQLVRPSGAVDPEALDPIAEPALAALLALLVADLLPDPRFALLYGPFEPEIPSGMLGLPPRSG